MQASTLHYHFLPTDLNLWGQTSCICKTFFSWQYKALRVDEASCWITVTWCQTSWVSGGSDHPMSSFQDKPLGEPNQAKLLDATQPIGKIHPPRQNCRNIQTNDAILKSFEIYYILNLWKIVALMTGCIISYHSVVAASWRQLRKRMTHLAYQRIN